MVNRYRSFNGMMILVWCGLLLVLIIAACGEDDEPENPPEPTIEATLEEPTEIAQEITPTTIGPSLTPFTHISANRHTTSYPRSSYELTNSSSY